MGFKGSFFFFWGGGGGGGGELGEAKRFKSLGIWGCGFRILRVQELAGFGASGVGFRFRV